MAVNTFFASYNLTIPCNIACVGKNTANALTEFSVRPDFIGEGNIDSITSNFAQLLTKADHVLIPQSDISKQSFQKQLQPKQYTNLVVYETELAQPTLKPFDAVLFTSPSNVESFVHKNQLPQLCFAIGDTTAHKLKEFGVKPVVLKNHDANCWIDELEALL